MALSTLFGLIFICMGVKLKTMTRPLLVFHSIHIDRRNAGGEEQSHSSFLAYFTEYVLAFCVEKKRLDSLECLDCLDNEIRRWWKMLLMMMLIDSSSGDRSFSFSSCLYHSSLSTELLNLNSCSSEFGPSTILFAQNADVEAIRHRFFPVFLDASAHRYCAKSIFLPKLMFNNTHECCWLFCRHLKKKHRIVIGNIDAMHIDKKISVERRTWIFWNRNSEFIQRVAPDIECVQINIPGCVDIFVQFFSENKFSYVENGWINVRQEMCQRLPWYSGVFPIIYISIVVVGVRHWKADKMYRSMCFHRREKCYGVNQLPYRIICFLPFICSWVLWTK